MQQTKVKAHKNTLKLSLGNLEKKKVKPRALPKSQQESKIPFKMSQKVASKSMLNLNNR